jgi:hypothetical protein|eukprot:g1184.t1
MKSALRARDFSGFSTLLSDAVSLTPVPVNDVAAGLGALRMSVYGARASIGASGCIEAILSCMRVCEKEQDVQFLCLNVLYYLLDHPPNREAALGSGLLDLLLKAFQNFPENKKIQSNASGIVWITAADLNCIDRSSGLYRALQSACKLQHFQNLEVGQRNPYRFKLVMPERALGRLEQNFVDHAESF